MSGPPIEPFRDTPRILSYDGEPTSGQGVIVVRKHGQAAAQVAACVICQYTPAFDSSVHVGGSIDVLVSSGENFTLCFDFTDALGPHTAIIPLRLLSGANVLAVTSANGAVPYLGNVVRARILGGLPCKLYTTGVFTGCTYNVRGGVNEVSIR